MIITKTPLRISFAGGGTDLPSYYIKNQYGCVVSSTINKYLYVIVKKREKVFDESIRLNYSETELVKNINQIKNPIIKACLEYINIKEDLYISTFSDLPSQSGLGSSSSFCVGLLKALYAYKKVNISSKQLSQVASDIEINHLNRPIGKQDHYAATYGGLNYFIFKKNKVSVNKIKISKKNLLKINNSLLLFWTGVTRSATSILSDQEKNTNQNLILLKEIKEFSDNLYNYMTNDKFAIKTVGKLMNKNWKNKKKLSKKISNELIEKIYTIAIKNGAYGGKLCGAGGGGFMFFLSPKKNHKKIEAKLSSINVMKIEVALSSEGSKLYHLGN